MIVDRLSNLNYYKGIDEKITKALNYLVTKDFSQLDPGSYLINKDKSIFAIVDEYKTKAIDYSKWEAHKKYIDIQYIYEGSELIGYSNINKLEITKKYNINEDIAWYYSKKNSFVLVEKGDFMILYPEDAHMPGIVSKKICKVKKIVVKILID